ncbi:PREDICTED: uncharacterized protein LOC109587086 [Amphimedon queenslandica]|uniref:Uncharacterized protein n=1 Tax=Amphimedon queenslandica TaxID=400682 RepID=A0AAN0JPX4_AMPQE|nr:PREDICTED: uncharacterized protein LOC109587086 [Amphimedon queenslandica]|eukprot:XP_019858866.1 PREDICTED: uncharacterized protein LOC109587086 [Amphimedon queenslandica]
MIEGEDKRILPLTVDSSDFIDAITQLKPVQIKGDPLLQIQLVKVSSEIGHYIQLVNLVDIRIVLLDLGIKLRSPRYQSQKKVREITAVILFLCEKKEILSFDSNALEYLQFLLSSLSAITRTLHSLNEDGRDAFVASFQLLLHTMNKLETNKKKEELQHTVPFVENWTIVHNGENFSCGSKKDTQKEYQFWVDMYSIDDQSLEWKEILQNIIFNRFEKIKNFKLMVQVFERLVSFSVDDDIIDVTRDCLVKHVSSANDMELQILAKGSSETQNILTNYIDMRFPSLPDSIGTLLEWDMWPTILTALTNTSSSKSQNICQHIKDILEDSQSKLKSGSVTVEMLLQLNEKWDTHLVQMVSTLSIDQHKFLDDIRLAVDRIQTFKFFLMLLKKFCSSLSTASDLLTNHKKCFLNSLCIYDADDGWIFPLFPEFEAKMMTPMIIQFTIMSSEELTNDIFYFKLQQLTKNVTQELSLKDVYHDLWVPLFDHCCSVANELKGETITLSRLSMIFGGTESADSEKTIKKLLSAVEKCHMECINNIGLLVDICGNDVSKLAEKIETKSLDTQWVKKIGRKITDWSNVQALSTEADQLMEALEAYDLDKSIVHHFSKQGIQTFLNEMLKYVTDDDEKVLLLLKSSRLYSWKVKESIKKLGECKDLRLFIKSKSKDVSEMERFIQIALDIVAGEGAEMQDRLIDLSELCGKFYPLLYQIDSSTTTQDVSTIQMLFQQTWESLTTHDDPLTLTESCISHAKWYQFIGQLQGAGEQGTVKQLRDINEHGEYTVSTIKDLQECTVSLEIVSGDSDVSDDSHVSKKFWTLDDLHEIESKLVLITRQTSAWVDAKNSFQEMLGKVCQICDVVQKLKEYGHMKYLKWDMILACSYFLDNLARLDKEIEELEKILSKWIGYVWRCRYQYSELNYYKTNQLIVLREELTKVKENEDHQISLQVFRLLNSTIGKPLESELIVRKALKGDVSLDDKYSATKKEFHATQSASQPDQVEADIESDSEIISKVSQSLVQVRNDKSMNMLYEESNPLGYPDYLILQALLNENITDIFDMMEWYGELSEDDIDKYKKEWMVNDVETKKSPLSTAESSPDSLCESSPESFVDIDINHVAKYFFKRMESSRFEKTTSIADETDFISLDNLGKCLQTIAARQKCLKEREFPRPFEQGLPNLVITTADNIFICTLQIYSAGQNSSLPTFDEVFLCSESTTLEEV